MFARYYAILCNRYLVRAHGTWAISVLQAKRNKIQTYVRAYYYTHKAESRVGVGGVGFRVTVSDQGLVHM